MSNDKYYVLVIGAGLSGLSCASELQDKHVKVDVVEASDRIGGRIMSDKCKLAID
jgi:monoamine oxidase